MADVTVSRQDVIGFRWRRHQLDRPAGAASSATDVAILDLGVQDTGAARRRNAHDAAAWALTIRGAPPPHDADLLLAWTLRGAPHAYRRADASGIVVAAAPFSEADAAKRVFDAAKPLKAAGIEVLDALRAIAGHERRIVTRPTVKGELSTRLTAVLDDPYLRSCRACNATHAYEQPFRLAALQAGLELEPGTSPPLLRRIPQLRPRPYARLGGEAAPRLDVVRNYLRFYGPARAQDVAAYLDAPVRDVRAHWPEDVVEITVDGVREPRRAILAEDVGELRPASGQGAVRLLGPFDPYLQLRDRDTLVAEKSRRDDLWRVLGRPGAVVTDGDLIGTWRPRTAAGKLTVAVEPWRRFERRIVAAVETEAARLAEHRGVRPAGVDYERGA